VVVVAAGRDEQRAGAVAHNNIEAQHIVVERLGRLQIGHVQVHMANCGRRRKAIPGPVVAVQLAQDTINVERVGCHLDLATWPRPLGARAVAVDLDTMPVRVR